MTTLEIHYTLVQKANYSPFSRETEMVRALEMWSQRFDKHVNSRRQVELDKVSLTTDLKQKKKK
jgi:hypothetical protein